MKIIISLLFSLFYILLSVNAFADIENDLTRGMSNCIKISEDDVRLTCFDQLAQTSLTSLNLAQVIVQPAVKVKSLEEKTINDFAKDDLKKTPEARGPNSIVATILNVNQLIRGQWVIDLENGQKWQQQGSGKLALKVGDTIRLKKGSMGAVYLFKNGSHRNIRVKRLK